MRVNVIRLSAHLCFQKGIQIVGSLVPTKIFSGAGQDATNEERVGHQPVF